MAFDFDAYETQQNALADAERGAFKQRMPYTMVVDGDLVSAFREARDVQPFGMGVRMNVPDKPTADDLSLEITKREKAGACLYVVKKATDSWYVEFFNNNFYLTAFSLAMKEKVQVMETFGSAVVSFFGDSVRVFNFGGIALDWTTANQSVKYKNFHQSGLIHMYNNIMRGTKLVDNNRIAVMAVGNHYVYGYPLSMSVNYTSESEKLSRFNMAWVVVDHSISYPYQLEESDLENLYKVDVTFRADITENLGPPEGATDVMEFKEPQAPLVEENLA